MPDLQCPRLLRRRGPSMSSNACCVLAALLWMLDRPLERYSGIGHGQMRKEKHWDKPCQNGRHPVSLQRHKRHGLAVEGKEFAWERTLFTVCTSERFCALIVS
eukprot:3941357-Rhodomonas_salina.2